MRTWKGACQGESYHHGSKGVIGSWKRSGSNLLYYALMLTYLLGDVLRVFSGDFVAGEVSGMQITQGIHLGMATLMVILILMIFLSMTLPTKPNAGQISSWGSSFLCST
jgi:hypothetical protein